jgi:peptidoglycan endopeptidase LytE
MKGRYFTAAFFAFIVALPIPYAIAASPSASAKAHNKTNQYVIRRGDSLYRIARAFDTTQEALIAENQLIGNKIKVGQVLKIPTNKSTLIQSEPLNLKNSPDGANELPASTNAQIHEGSKTDLSNASKQSTVRSLKTSQSDIYQEYVTRRGDTLFQIAKTFNTTPKALKTANKLKNSRIKVGQTLKVPAILSAASIAKSPDIDKTPETSNTEIFTMSAPPQMIADQKNAESLPLRDRLVEAGFQMLGIRYRFSGTSEITGLDCSALVKNLFSKVNIAVPRSSREQFKTGEKIDRGNLEAGDLVFFSSGGKTPTHVGIYIGNNQFIHAARKAKQVIVSDLNKLWYSTRYLGARRIMDLWWEEPETSSDSENK